MHTSGCSSSKPCAARRRCARQPPIVSDKASEALKSSAGEALLPGTSPRKANPEDGEAYEAGVRAASIPDPPPISREVLEIAASWTSRTLDARQQREGTPARGSLHRPHQASFAGLQGAAVALGWSAVETVAEAAGTA